MSHNYRILYLSFISLLILLGLVSCQSVESPYIDIVDKSVQEVMDQYKIPGLAIAIIEHNNISYVETYGKANNTQMVTPETIFNVASLTKPLFALSYLHLVQQNMADLDESLYQYWIDPDVQDDPRLSQLTARLVLSHQSGFPNWRGSKGLRFLFSPGERHEYSGEGYEYLRRSIESQTGESYSAIMERNILTPLAMNHTYLGWSEDFQDHLAVGYDEQGNPIGIEHLKDRGPNAAASTFTTIEDYARFAAWVSDGASLSPELYNQMSTLQSAQTDPLEFYGLGWRLTRMSDRTILEHDGREPGVRTLVMVDPYKERAFVLFTNSSNGELIVRSLVNVIWDDGHAILNQRDQDTWYYLSALPDQSLLGMLGFISRSPSFTMKLLYAANAGMVDSALLSKVEQQELENLIDDMVFSQFRGDVTSEQVQEVFQELGQSTEQGFHFYSQMNVDQVHQWMDRMRSCIGFADTHNQS